MTMHQRVIAQFRRAAADAVRIAEELEAETPVTDAASSGDRCPLGEGSDIDSEAPECGHTLAPAGRVQATGLVTSRGGQPRLLVRRSSANQRNRGGNPWATSGS